MGWLGIGDFIATTDAAKYEIRDNHIRFIGGIWAGLGLFMWLAAVNPMRFKQSLYLVFGLIFLAGFARFTSGNLELVFGPDILGSLVTELVGMPIFALWLSKLPEAQ